MVEARVTLSFARVKLSQVSTVAGPLAVVSFVPAYRELRVVSPLCSRLSRTLGFNACTIHPLSLLKHGGRAAKALILASNNTR